jgi:hypothetical protein
VWRRWARRRGAGEIRSGGGENNPPGHHARMASLRLLPVSLFRSRAGAWILCAAGLLLAGCATRFPVATPEFIHPDGRDGAAVLAATLAAHGGDLRQRGGDIAAAITGEWSTLITRIQPLVTDHRWRIDAQERMLPAEGRHAIRWSGPAGEKVVVRTPAAVRVFYNGVENFDDDVLASSAMTSDAFQLFLCGPSFIAWRASRLERLADIKEDGRTLHRVLAVIEPGFGRAPRDEVVLFIDAQDHRLWRVWFTLEGFRTTRGATADVTFLRYQAVGGVLLPVAFDERVRAPISVHAHAWRTIGLDLDRGLTAADVDGVKWSEKAMRPAAPLP